MDDNVIYYVVKYSGPFGFIKPWTAVRDGETYSQQFLTPSIVEGIEKKLFPEMLQCNGEIRKILRHKLSYTSIDVLNRGVLLNPVLHLAFGSMEDAEIAARQHICLCRNEDVLIPSESIMEKRLSEFDKIDGFELRFGASDESFMVGFNRFDSAKPMYGWLEISGKPVSGF